MTLASIEEQIATESALDEARRKKRQELYSAALREVWKRRSFILWVSGAVGVVTLLVNFFVLWQYYRSTTTILPETDRSRIASLGQLANLADIAGSLGGPPTMAKLYPSILTSETVLRSVIGREYQNTRYGHPVNLLDYFDISGDTFEDRMQKMLKGMNSLVSASTEAKTGIVTLSVEMPESQMSADVANAIVETMDSFLQHNQNTSASEQAKWVKSRLDTVGEELKTRENDLRDFREQNRIVASSPALALRQDRLMREVEIKSAVLIELSKQLELAKIDEVKNISYVNVLDHAIPPVKKSRPTRLINTVLMTLITAIGLAGILGGRVAFPIIRRRWEKAFFKV